MSVIILPEAQDGAVIPSEPAADCPELCGCEESTALREILEVIVEYDENVNPCDPDFCKGECAFCKGRALLAKLAEERKLRTR